MLRMVRVESEREYEELWKEYNKELLQEPFLPENQLVEENTFFAMSPEFTLVVRAKLNEMVEFNIARGLVGGEEEDVEDQEEKG